MSGQTTTATARPEPWENPDPERFHFEPMLAERFRIAHEGRPCRFTVGPGHRTCKQPGVVAIQRPRRTVNNHHGFTWWHYCAEHTYGRWVEDGQVWQWRLVRNSPAAPDNTEPEGDA